MNKTYKIIIVFGIVSIIPLFYFYISANGFSFYNEGLSLTYLSNNTLQEELKAPFMQGVEIQTITDKDFEPVPKIKELIESALTKKFPLNKTGKILSDKDVLKQYHKYYAMILAKKYSKDPGDFFKILPAYPAELEQHPDAYRYEFTSDFFEYGGVQYGWSNSQFTDYGDNDNLINIEIYKVSHPLDPQRQTYAEITDEDLVKMPLLKEAIDNIGTIQENIEIQNNMSGEEVNRYKKWYEQNIKSFIFEYDGNYFKIGFWMA